MTLIRPIFFLLASLMMTSLITNYVFAEHEIVSKSFSIDNTSIIEFTNNGVKDIKIIKIWLTTHFFESYKSEIGWTSTITPQQVIEFVASDPIKTNETAKFGIITEKPTSLIFWKAIDGDGNQIETGKSQSQPAPSFVIRSEETSKDTLPGILSESSFRISPKILYPGSTIRVIGENFSSDTNLELFLDNFALKSFETDKNGDFILTLKIPQTIQTNQVNFILKDNQKNEKIINQSLNKFETPLKNIELTLFEIESKYNKNDIIDFSGNITPGTPITIIVRNPEKSILSTITTTGDQNGHWSTSLKIPSTAVLGEYTAVVSDGKNTLFESWDVVMSKNIHIIPEKAKFNFGEQIKFNGTAITDKEISIKFIDPHGNELLSKNIISNTGFFDVDYMTSNSSLEGTYTLYVFQENNVEVSFVGVNIYPQIPLSVKFNAVHYVDSVAIIGITGQPLQNVKLLVLDENGHEVFDDKIELGSDGKKIYDLNLSNFYSGNYVLLASISSFQTSDIFTVGLKPSSKLIDIDMVETNYAPGQSLLFTVKSDPDAIINLSLIDPYGILVNKKELFADKSGNLLINDLMIPYDAVSGTWIIRSDSGTKSDVYPFRVTSLNNDDLYIRVSDISSSSLGTFVTLEGTVSDEQRVKIFINNTNNEIIFQTNVRTTENGEFDLLWKVPSEYVSSTISITVQDIFKKQTSILFDLSTVE